MPKYYQYKVAGYYLYFTSKCVVECMHVHASDRRLTEEGSAKLFVMGDGRSAVQKWPWRVPAEHSCSLLRRAK